MSFEPEPSVEDWGGTSATTRRSVRAPSLGVNRRWSFQASTSTRGWWCERGDDPIPDTGRPGLLTSTNVEPDGSTASRRSATATFSLMSPASPSRTSRPERRWNTSGPPVYDAERDAGSRTRPARPTACAAVAAPAAVSSAPIRTAVRVEIQIRGSFGSAVAARRSITRPRVDTSQLSEPRRKTAAGAPERQ